MKIYNSNQKVNPIDKEESVKIDYKNVQLLQKYISETGKILPRRVTLASAKNQRRLAKAIKTSRTMALIPYKTD